MKKARLRASTVILVALFVGSSVLYLFVRPTTGSSAGTSTPVTTAGH